MKYHDIMEKEKKLGQAELNEMLFAAVRKGRLNALENVLKLGADINAQDMDGWTPLIYAAVYKKQKAAQLLIENGADPKIKTKTGYGPFDFGDEKINAAIAEALKKMKRAEE